jgi:hypothetical protein
MRTIKKKSAGFILLLFAVIGTASAIGAQSAQAAAHMLEVETGRPSVLINRPSCGLDGFPDEWSRCQFIDLPQSKSRPWYQPDP